jgi:uncharacterized protein
MSQQDVKAVRTAYQAINDGNMDPYLAIFDAENGEFTEAASLPYGGTYKGHAGLDELFAKLDECWEDLTFNVEKILDAGDHVVVISRVSGRAKATGRRMEEPITEVLEMRDGKIVSSHSRLDTARLLQALGVDPTPAA